MPSQQESHIVYGIGSNATEALAAARRNLPPNAFEVAQDTYPVNPPRPSVMAEIAYQLRRVPEPARGHGAAAPTPFTEILYRVR